MATGRRAGSKAAKGGAERSELAPSAPSQRKPQSAAVPSPFTPIADYGFLSNCHIGALVAPDGAVDWLCVPSFDSPSIFGSLLDREAGTFRVGPFGIHVPTARSYEPGTNTLATTWHTPTGWILVRDALTIGPGDGEDEVTPHTRPPADDDGDHMLVRTVLCLEGSVEVELICEPVFDYGRTPAQWSLVEGDRHVADATEAEQTVRLRTDMALGIEGDTVRARRTLTQGDQAYCSLSWADSTRLTRERRPSERPPCRHDSLLACMAGTGDAAGPPVPGSRQTVGSCAGVRRVTALTSRGPWKRFVHGRAISG